MKQKNTIEENQAVSPETIPLGGATCSADWIVDFIRRWRRGDESLAMESQMAISDALDAVCETVERQEREINDMLEHFAKCHAAIGESSDSDKSELWKYFENYNATINRLIAVEKDRDQLRDAVRVCRNAKLIPAVRAKVEGMISTTNIPLSAARVRMAAIEEVLEILDGIESGETNASAMAPATLEPESTKDVMAG
jgi:hypothetical protein